MKKILIIIFALLSQITSAQTNVYHKFPESSAFWNFHLASLQQQGGYCFGSQDYTIIITGDTVINTSAYHKLYIPFIQSIGLPCGEHLGYKGAFRQDTILKKVYIIPTNQTSEQLWYDFNLQTGDTIKGFLAFWWPYYNNVVINIDSVLVGNSFCKRWNLSDSCYIISIIEGVGSTYGLIESSSPCVTVAQSYTLNCFNYNGISLYPDTASNCDQVTQINSLNISSNSIKVYPNPSNGIFAVDIDPSLNICKIIISDLLGNIILQQKVNNQTELSIDKVPNGIYLLSFIAKNGRVINRKIISSL